MSEPPDPEVVILNTALALPASQRESYLEQARGGNAATTDWPGERCSVWFLPQGNVIAEGLNGAIYGIFVRATKLRRSEITPGL